MIVVRLLFIDSLLRWRPPIEISAKVWSQFLKTMDTECAFDTFSVSGTSKILLT